MDVLTNSRTMEMTHRKLAAQPTALVYALGIPGTPYQLSQLQIR